MKKSFKRPVERPGAGKETVTTGGTGPCRDSQESREGLRIQRRGLERRQRQESLQKEAETLESWMWETRD